MSASLSGVWNSQDLTSLGALAAGYRLYTYTSGTTTFKTAYTDAAGLVPHTYTSDGLGGQYIALDARGELPAPLFLTAGAYDIALKTAAGATIWTRYARGGEDAAVTFASSLASSANGSGADLVGGVGRVVNTVSALRALAKTGVGKAFVLGYYAQGDGGGGQYWYDSTDTTSADNGGTILVASDGGRWKLQNAHNWVSVKQFGAKGDFNGTTGTDDTTAIQNAINWAQLNTNTGTYGSFSPSVGTGVVYFPQGTYKVTAALVVGYKICILGEGQTEFSYGSRLYQTTANTDLIQFNAATGSTSFSIEKMILSTTAAVGTGHLVNVTRTGPYVNSQRYKDCTFAQPQAKALLLTGDDIEIDSCLFDVSQKSGDCIQLGTAAGIASNVRINNCNFFNITNSVVKLVNIDGLSWGSGNTVTQPNTTTKTLRVFDAISTAPTLATNIAINGGVIKGPRTLFGGNNVTNLTMTGVSVVQGGIGAGEVNHMLTFTGNCSANIAGNWFRGTYDTANFYNDAGALNVFGQIASNFFINDGGAGDALSCTKLTGRILSNDYSGFVNRQMGEKRATSGSPVNPGSIAAGATFGFTLTVQGATFGDTVNMGTISNAWVAQTGIDVRSYVSAANTARIEYRNVTGGAIVVAAHDVWCEVTR